MTFGMGQARQNASSLSVPPVARPQPSIPKPAPSPPVTYQPSAPTVYSTSTYDDEDGEDSIYADNEGTWPPAPPPSMASVPPTPPAPRTAADGNASYPDFPKPVQVSKLAAGTKKTRVKPKGPSGSKSHGGGSGSFGQRKDAYDPVWRPDAV
ncbi:hypothetical protein BKA70DRAFT_1280968 [Coprinopsis sp. MPI-PUGE-AT-0042]|nr:hypothetical protein BKA70DRAFT_1280968 [Coprinopsis sp. MPI-PUGE-AT-0042]